MSNINNNIKSITVIKGQEYKVCKINMKDENNFLYNSYLQANNCLKEITEFRNFISEFRKSNSKGTNYNYLNYEHLNNIIAFCGERGQGKTSAMLSYADILSESKNNQYCIMKTIDPTSLEKNDNILMMILSAIFNEFKKKWGNLESLHNNINIDKILELFQKAHHHISAIKCVSNKELNNDFDETMENLSKYGDSMDLKSSFEELITEFMHNYGNKDGYFVIPIDDTDLNIERAFEIVEDIRKYLVIPNVIILMATKFEQLKIAVEQHFRQSYKTMLKANRVSDIEISQMASKYLDKLIPETRRINVPKIDVVDANGNLPTIIYKESSDENADDILSYYGDNLQDQIINYIEAKTAICFDTDNLNSRVHWIIPQTMRELVNLLAFLSKMNTVGENKNGQFYFKLEFDQNGTNRPVIKNLYDNLNGFYIYFRTSWVANNLCDDEITSIENIINTDIQATHMQTLLELKKRVSKLDDAVKNAYPDKITNVSNFKKYATLTERIDEIIKNISISNKYSYSLGNIFDALMAIEMCAGLDSVLKFTFAVKTIYTLKMMLIAAADVLHEDIKSDDLKSWNNSTIIQFIGIDFIGEYNANSLFPSIGSSQVRRGRFNVPISVFNDEFKKVSRNNFDNAAIQTVEDSYLKQLVFLGYNDSDYDYLQDKSGNNRDFSNLYCNVSYYFIYTIRNTTVYKSNIVFKMLNVENIFNIVSEQMRVKDKLKKEAVLKNMYIGFFKSFGDFHFREDIIKDLSDDNEYIVALNNALNKHYQVINNDNKIFYYVKRQYFISRRRKAFSEFSKLQEYICDSINNEKSWPSEINKLISDSVFYELEKTKNELKIVSIISDEQRENIYEQVNHVINRVLSEKKNEQG